MLYLPLPSHLLHPPAPSGDRSEIASGPLLPGEGVTGA